MNYGHNTWKCKGNTGYLCVYERETIMSGRKYIGYFGQRKVRGIKMRTGIRLTAKDAATDLDVLHIKNDLEPINVLKKK